MNVIQFPISTEKALRMMESENKLVFQVDDRATKQDIRIAIEKELKAKVVSVNVVRTIRGHMIDLVLDIRKGSPTYGQATAYDMPVQGDEDFTDWIWVPPGFAHGNTFPADTVIEYFCSGEYSPGCEAGISPLAADIDWSLCPPDLLAQVQAIVPNTSLISDKDRDAFSLAAWTADPRSENFLYDDLR